MLRPENIICLYETLGGPTYTDENVPFWWDSQQTTVHYSKVPLTYAERVFVQNPENSGLFDQELEKKRIADSVIERNQLPLFTDFPFIEDFDIVLVRIKTKNIVNGIEKVLGRYEVRFFSPSRGYLARILYSPVKSKYGTKFEGAYGTLERPFSDFDQGYKLLLFEDDTFVYVLQGSDWENDEYYSWFKVDKLRYYERWESVVRLARDVPIEDE